MTALLVTNDFPPKVGGIQTYLWELWRRLPPAQTAVLTTRHAGAATFDAQQGFRIHRVADPVLLPTPSLARRIRNVAAQVDASLVVLDPALPVGGLGPALGLPYAVVLHGAEVTVPARLPLLRPQLARVISGAAGLVAAGGYPLAQASHAVQGMTLPDVVIVPPGVDTGRFVPLDPTGRPEARAALGLPTTGPLVLTASRLVPRKGMDVLIQACTRLVAHRPDLTLVIAGAGRDRRRLQMLAARHGMARRVKLLGRVADADLPALYASADVFAMLCRDRWAGLEQEGFGIVFLEAAAAGVPQVAGRSGGAAEAVVDGVTGLVVADPRDPEQAAAAVGGLLDDDDRRSAMGAAARQRAVSSFSWDLLADELRIALQRWSVTGPTR